MKQSATGLAIAGFVIGLVAVFVPIVGIYVSAFALALCAVAAFMGDKVFTIATVAITAVKTFFLSPTFAALAGGNGALMYVIVGVALAIPLLAMFLGSGSRADSSDAGSNTTGMPRR